MKSILVYAVAIAAVALAASAAASGPAETIRLGPKNASGVSGTATISSPGDEAAAKVAVRVKGLKPGATARVMLTAGSCKRPGASTTRILAARADARGAFAASGRVFFRGGPVTFATIADGFHAILVVADGRVVACGVVPGMN